MELTIGQRVTVTDAGGKPWPKRVLAPIDGTGDEASFVACTEAEWEAAQREGREPESDPFAWPASAVASAS